MGINFFGISFTHPWALLALLLPLAWLGWDRWRRRRPGPARLTPFEWLRLLIIALLILALAGTGITYSARNQAVMFIADLSSSTATVRAEMEGFIKRAIGEMNPGDMAGVLAVGEDAQLETPVSHRPTFSGFTAVVRPDHTDLERGLRLGAALLPGGYRRRVVLLSDGHENVGNAMAEVQRLRQRGFTVDVVNVAPKPGPEALIKSIEAPGAIRQGERLDLTMTLTASATTNAQLRIYQERTLLETRPLTLHPGDQQVRITMDNLPSGYHRLWATLEAEQDTLTQNNESAVLVNVQGAPSILVVEGFPGAGTNMKRALESTGMVVDLRTPDGLPTHGPQFARYASIVMVDVPAPFLRSTSLEAISSYVKQTGHGLVVVGGENSYAMGGYGGTKLEELLPVTMDVPQRREQPPVAVGLIIENFESDAKVNISKEAGKALIDMLTPRDTVLVSDATVIGMWAVPPQKVNDKAQIKAMIDAMAPGDPPHYMEHMEAVARELVKIDAKIKHIVLAGDGDAQMISFQEYAERVARISAMGITVSSVHVNWLRPGEEVLMQLIAQMGNGRYYLASDAGATPQIFLKEAQAMARPGVVEEDFYPAVLSPSPILSGIGGLPMLRGYIATTPKPTGEVVLQSAQADPVLSAWQTGLGRVVAFTSDTGGLWSEQMVLWEEFNRFWSNVVSWTMPAVDEQAIRTMASVVGGKAHLTVQIPGEGLAVGGVGGENSWPANIVAGVIRPDGSTQILSLQATAPGQYEGEIPASMPGPYLVRLSAGTKRQSTTLGETFIVVPYSPEFATSGADPKFMERLARAGGGEVLTDPKLAFARNLPPAPGRLPLEGALLLLALLLWPVDIAARRLSITPAEIAEGIRRRRERRQALATDSSATAA
ncbi:MAG: glutamine amidotransferase, partial [Bacillota bacterium]